MNRKPLGGLTFGPHSQFWHQRQTKACSHQSRQRPQRPCPHVDARRRTLHAADLQRLIGQTMTILQQHQLFGAQITGPQLGLACLHLRQPPGRTGQQEPVGEQLHLHQVCRATGQRKDRGVQLSRLQQRQQPFGACFAHLHRQLHIARPQIGKRSGQQIGRQRRDHPQRKAALPHPLITRQAVQTAGRVQHGIGHLQNLSAKRRQDHVPRPAFNKRTPHRLFQTSDLHGQGRLRHM